MARKLRFIPEDSKLWQDDQGRPYAIVEVTVRTIMGMYLLKPTPRNTALILGVLGRAQHELDFEYFGYVVLSNHIHLLIGVRCAIHQALIMNYIHGNIASELSRPELSNCQGRFWAGRGEPIVLGSDEDVVDRLRYILSNGVKEHLVTRPTRWPGAHCSRALLSGRPDKGSWVDRTALGRLRRSRPEAEESEVTTIYPVKLSRIPCWADLDEETYRCTVLTLCKEIEAAAAQERQGTSRRVVGVKRILGRSAHYIPGRIERKPAPRIHCRYPKVRQRFLDAYRLFVEAYRHAYQCLCEKVSGVGFPPGGHPPVGVVFEGA